MEDFLLSEFDQKQSSKKRELTIGIYLFYILWVDIVIISYFYCTQMYEKSPFHIMDNMNVPIQFNPYLFQLGWMNNSPICYSIFSIDCSTMQDIVATQHNYDHEQKI